MENNFKVVKKSPPRHEALSKAMGTALYTDDMKFDNLAYGLVVRSPHAHAKVISMDKAAAMAVQGVIGVISAEDVTDRLFNCSGNPPSPSLAHDEVILTNHPKCLGDRVAAVVAESYEACVLASRALNVQYEVLKPNFSIKDALKEEAYELQPNTTQEKNMFKNMVFSEGDVQEGLNNAEHVFEGSFTTRAQAHVALEPTICVCDYTADGRVTIHSNSQTLYQERRILAEVLDMNETDIRIIKPAMGSGFGARQQLHNQHVGIILSKLAKRPVKILHTREEEMYATATRHETESNYKFGLDKDGMIKTFKGENFLNGGPYTTHSIFVSAAAGRKFQYHADNYLYEGKSIVTNSPTGGAFRGYGNIQFSFGREVMMSRIAKAFGEDPVQFRLKNHLKVGDRFPSADYSLDSCEIEACVKRADEIKEKIDNENPLVNNDRISEAWGHAFACHSSGPSNKDGMSSAIIMVNTDGSANLLIGSADIGQGSETVMKQITAEKLGLSYEKVNVRAADTDTTPYDTGTFASGQTYVCGNAVSLACDDVIVKLKAAIIHYFDLPENSVEYDNGIFSYTHEGEKVEKHFSEAVKTVYFGMRGSVIIGSASYKAKSSPPPFAVCYAKVRHDKMLNSISITDVIQVVDVGTAINPEAVRGQVEGGIAQGIGYAMFEDLEIDKISKRTFTTDLLHYKAPLSVDMPNVYADIVDGYEPSGPLGAKSVGELTIIAVAPAIVNAIEVATEKVIDHIPVSNLFMPKSQGRQNI